MALHHGEDEPSPISGDEELVRLVLGEYRQCAAASLQTLHVFNVGLRASRKPRLDSPSRHGTINTILMHCYY